MENEDLYLTIAEAATSHTVMRDGKIYKVDVDDIRRRDLLPANVTGAAGGAIAGGIAGAYATGVKAYRGYRKYKASGASASDLKTARQDAYRRVAKGALKGAAIGGVVGAGGSYAYSEHERRKANSPEGRSKRAEEAVDREG